LLSYILVIAIFNLALGYAAAAALADDPPWGRWRWPKVRRRIAASAAHSASTRSANIAARPLAAVSVTIAALEELPKQWLEQLAEARIIAKSFLEGAAHVLRLEVGRYREQLVGIETRCRSLLAAADGPGLKLLAEDLSALNQHWLEGQRSAASLLTERAGRMGEHDAAAQALEQVLLDQAAQIQAINALLAGLNFAIDAENSGKQMLDQLATLVSAAHALRDSLLDLVATLLRQGRRLGELNEAARLDPETGLPGRLGLEAVLSAWWQEDAEGSRPLAAVCLDIDRFGRVNQRLGTRAGDRTLVAAAGLIGELIHKDREHDCVCRIAGQSLLVVMADAGPRQALDAAERLRQSFEATTFDDQGTTFELTVSCGVAGATRDGGAAGLLRRSLAAVQFAKKAGRNRCALDEGQGPATFDPPQLPVKGRIVRLGE
jgi:diguanylate cyclase